MESNSMQMILGLFLKGAALAAGAMTGLLAVVVVFMIGAFIVRAIGSLFSKAAKAVKSKKEKRQPLVIDAEDLDEEKG